MTKAKQYEAVSSMVKLGTVAEDAFVGHK